MYRGERSGFEGFGSTTVNPELPKEDREAPEAFGLSTEDRMALDAALSAAGFDLEQAIQMSKESEWQQIPNYIALWASAKPEERPGILKQLVEYMNS